MIILGSSKTKEIGSNYFQLRAFIANRSNSGADSLIILSITDVTISTTQPFTEILFYQNTILFFTLRANT